MTSLSTGVKQLLTGTGQVEVHESGGCFFSFSVSERKLNTECMNNIWLSNNHSLNRYHSQERRTECDLLF